MINAIPARPRPRDDDNLTNRSTSWTAIVRMRFHQPTIDYVARRTAQGLTKKDVIRCLKRFIAREVYQRVMTDQRARTTSPITLTATGKPVLARAHQHGLDL
jgi:hypothetical protein